MPKFSKIFILKKPRSNTVFVGFWNETQVNDVQGQIRHQSNIHVMMKIEFESKGLDELQNRYFDLYWMNQRPQKPVLKLHNSRLLSVIAIGPTIKFYWVKTKSANVFTKIKSGEEIHDSHQLFKDFPNDLRQISISSFEVIY